MDAETAVSTPHCRMRRTPPASVPWSPRLLALGLVIAAFAGCASEITLRHEFTRETAVCKGSPFSQELVRCLERYEREGYRRVAQ